MAYKHNTRQDGRIYGKLESDEVFTKRIKHINNLIDQGEPVRYYLDKFNMIRVYRNGVWYTMKELAKLEPKWSVEGVDK